MTYKEYLKIIKSKPVTEGLAMELAIHWLHPSWYPLKVSELTDKSQTFIRIPTKGINPHSKKDVLVVGLSAKAFSGNETITDVVLHTHIRGIPEGAFAGCVSLEHITIPKNVTVIGQDTFKDCNALADVYYEGTKEEWDKIRIVDSERVTEFGGMIPGTPVMELTSDRLVHLPGNDPLHKATIHFSCDLDFEPLASEEKGTYIVDHSNQVKELLLGRDE